MDHKLPLRIFCFSVSCFLVISCKRWFLRRSNSVTQLCRSDSSFRFRSITALSFCSISYRIWLSRSTRTVQDRDMVQRYQGSTYLEFSFLFALLNLMHVFLFDNYIFLFSFLFRLVLYLAQALE